MKHFYTFLVFLFISSLGFGQTTIYSQSFETNLNGYSHTPSQTPSSDSGDQYFHRAEPSDSDIYESGGPYTNVTGSWLFVGSNPNTFNGGSPGILEFGLIDVTGFSDLELLIDFGGVPNDWDASDELRVEYSWDNTTWNLMYSFSSPVTNDPLELENNISGGSNTANGATLTYALQTIFSDNFTGTGNNLYLRIVCDSNANYEAFGMDNLILRGIGSASGPDNPTAFTASTISTSQIDLAYEDNTDADNIVIVFNQDNNFDTPTGTPTVGNDFGDDEILFVGNGSGIFNHTGLTVSTTYFYRAYSYDGTEYSNGISADATTNSPDANANIVEASFDEPDNIDYLLYNVTSGLDENNAVKIAEFRIQDAGNAPSDSDNLTTTLQSLTFNVIGVDNIAALAILDDSEPIVVNLGEVNGIDVATSTTFNGLNIEALDDLTRTFSIYATFNSTVTDNEQVRLIITEAIADATGSTFAATNAGGALTSIDDDDNRIEVTATDLIFDTNTSNVIINEIMAPAPTVLAIDGNVNTDLDYTETMTLTPSTSGIYSISASFVVSAINGEATFDNLLFDTVGTGYTLTADSGALTTDTSSVFDVTSIIPLSGASDLFFSEYIEGSGNNKCLEIYNGTGADVDLSLYTIQIYINGNATPSSSSDIILSGTLIDGEVYVICDDNADSAFLTQADLTPTSNFFNGNDAVSLNKSGSIVDLIGNIGCDPASGQWFEAGSGNGTQNQTLVRNNNVCGGVTMDPTTCNGSFPTLGTEWTNFPEDTSSNLGTHMANCTTVVGCNTFGGNGKTGFGGPIGNSSLEVCAISGTTIDFTLTKGTGFLNDTMVLYIDSESGGIADTGSLTDSGDPGRQAVSGFSGSARSTVTFPPGFRPEYALVVNAAGSSLFGIVENGSHTFIQGGNLSPINNNNAASYTFNINFANINTTPNSESFNVLATYLDPSSAFRSNESIGRNTAVNNPGVNPIELTTYYQVNSGKQGGIARSDDDGLWSEDGSWTNGNAPLKNDEVLINNVITVDTDFEANSINISSGNILTVNAGQTLAIYDNNLDSNDGIFGSGALNVNGKLLISEGGFSNVVPTYTSGSTLEYRNIDASYDRFNEWTNGATLGAGVPDNVIIENASLNLTNASQLSFEDFVVASDVTLLTNGNLTVDANESLTIGGNLINTEGSLDLNSISTDYSSLLINGSSIGDVIYRRHVNRFNTVANSTTGENDLISPPVTKAGQTFSEFRNNLENTDIPSGLIGGVPSFLFGPFDNNANEYVNYTSANDDDVLIAGVGYRTASNTPNGSTFTFKGDVETADISVGISIGTNSEWNLIGNPYPTYINSANFLTANAASLDENAIGIYGYDGSAQNGWNVINFNNMNEATNMAPGQGFLVAAEGPTVIEFTTGMRRLGGGDDFIVGRMDNNEFLSLQIESESNKYNTDFYFNDNSTLGLDPGYDAGLFNSYLPDFYIYSHLVENNSGRAMAIQSLGSTDLSDVSIPLGVNANQGEQITFSIVESTLPQTVDVYLDDTVANTSTLLNNTNYVFTPNVNLSGTGRFFLRYTEDALSTNEQTLNNVEIFTTQTPKTLFVNGQLSKDAKINLYDIQGRVIFSSEMNHTQTSNQFNVSNLASGIYVVELKSNNAIITQKVIIK